MFTAHAFCVLSFALTLTPAQDASDRHVTGPEDGGPGETAIHLVRPRRITYVDIQRWSDMLRLSDEQYVYLESLHATYLRTDADLRRQIYLPLWQEAKRLGAVVDRVLTDIAVAEDIAALGDANKKANARLLASEDNAMFHPLIPVLTDEQVARLPAVRARRQRDAHREVKTALRSAATDFIMIMESLQDDEQWHVTDQQAFDALLQAYETSLNAGWRTVYDIFFKRHNCWDHGRLAGREAACLRLRRRSADAAENLVRLNETYLPLLQEHLAPETAFALGQRYREAAIPQFYPNPYGLGEVFSLALEIPGLTNEQRETIEMIRDTYRRRDAVIVQGMIREVEQWIRQFEETRQWGPLGQEEHEAKIAVASRSRRTLSRDTLDLLAGVLAPGDAARLRAMAEEKFATADAKGSFREGLYYFPVGDHFEWIRSQYPSQVQRHEAVD